MKMIKYSYINYRKEISQIYDSYDILTQGFMEMVFYTKSFRCAMEKYTVQQVIFELRDFQKCQLSAILKILKMKQGSS